jgi:hypothetical protein
MLRGDDGALLIEGSQHCAAGEETSPPEDSSRALVERRDVVIGEELSFLPAMARW